MALHMNENPIRLWDEGFVPYIIHEELTNVFLKDNEGKELDFAQFMFEASKQFNKNTVV